MRRALVVSIPLTLAAVVYACTTSSNPTAPDQRTAATVNEADGPVSSKPATIPAPAPLPGAPGQAPLPGQPGQIPVPNQGGQVGGGGGTGPTPTPTPAATPTPTPAATPTPTPAPTPIPVAVTLPANFKVVDNGYVSGHMPYLDETWVNDGAGFWADMNGQDLVQATNADRGSTTSLGTMTVTSSETVTVFILTPQLPLPTWIANDFEFIGRAYSFDTPTDANPNAVTFVEVRRRVVGTSGTIDLGPPHDASDGTTENMYFFVISTDPDAAN